LTVPARNPDETPETEKTRQKKNRKGKARKINIGKDPSYRLNTTEIA